MISKGLVQAVGKERSEQAVKVRVGDLYGSGKSRLPGSLIGDDDEVDDEVDGDGDGVGDCGGVRVSM